jgi:hypothetical protein
MKKLLISLSSAFLLSGCVESMALLGPVTGAANGKIVQASAKSAVSFGVKKTTGKSPIQHALAYAEEKNPNKNKEKCISFIEKTNSEACSIAKKQVALAQIKIKEIVSEKKISFKRQFNQARKEGKNSFIFNNKIYNTKFKKNDIVEKKIKSKKSAMELAISLQAAIKEKSKIK